MKDKKLKYGFDSSTIQQTKRSALTADRSLALQFAPTAEDIHSNITEQSRNPQNEGLSIIDWSKDAYWNFYNKKKSGEIDIDSHIQALAYQTQDGIDDAIYFKSNEDELVEQEQNTQDFQIKKQKYDDKVKWLRENGLWNETKDPTASELKEIKDNQILNWGEAEQRIKEANEDLKNSLKNHEISSAFTKKSIEGNSIFDNFFYKLPGLLGSSYTDIKHQLMSTASGILGGAIAGTAIGAIAGATGGTALAPVVGTAAGGIGGGTIGAIGGAIKGALTSQKLYAGLSAAVAAQAGGGQAARESESHMEAFDRYRSNLNDIIDKEHINIQPIVNNVKTQLKQLKQDYNITDEEAIRIAATHPEIKSGSSEFDKATQRAFRGISRLYERNNALGVGEFTSDALLYVPGTRSSAVLRFLQSPETEVATTMLPKALSYLKNPINKFIAKRGEAAAEATLENATKRSLTGKLLTRQLRNKAMLDTGKTYLGRMVEEGSEEGSQLLMSDDSSKGYLNDRNASQSVWQAIENGNLLSDMVDNYTDRRLSTLQMMGLADVYKDHDEMFDNYASGALLAVFDPRQMISAGKDAINFYNKQTKTKNFTDKYIAAMLNKDQIDRDVDLLEAIRQGSHLTGNYSTEILDNMRDALKSGKYDLGAISGDRGVQVTPENIDEYFDGEKEHVNKLRRAKKELAKNIKSYSLDDRQADIYTALYNDVITRREQQEKDYKEDSKRVTDPLNAILNDSYKGDDFDVANHAAKQEAEFLSNAYSFDNSKSEIVSDILRRKILNHIIHNNKLSQLHTILTALKNSTDVANKLSEFGINSTDPNIANRIIDSLEKAISKENVNIKILDGLIDGSLRDSIDQDTIDNVNNYLIQNPETSLQKEIQDNMHDEILSALSLDALRSEEKSFLNQNNGVQNKTYALSRISQYLSRVKRDAGIVDEANAEARGQISEEEKQAIANATDRELNNNLEESVNNITTSLENITSTNPRFSKTIERMKQGISAIKSAGGKASYVYETLTKLKAKVDEEKAAIMNEEDKKQLDELYSTVTEAKKYFDEIKSRNNKIRINSQKKPFHLFNDNKVWTDPNTGKKYRINYGDAQYSIDEGLILPVTEITDDPELNDIKQHIKSLKSQIKNLEKKSDLTDEQKEQLKAARQDLIDYENNKLAKKVGEKTQSLKVSENEDFFNSLNRKDNTGKEYLFSNKLKDIKAKVQDKIDEDVKQRDKMTEEAFDNGDVIETSDKNDNENLEWLGESTTEKAEKKGKHSIKFYPHMLSKFGKAIVNRLLNPFNMTVGYTGYISVTTKDSYPDIYEVKDGDSEETKKIKQARTSALKTFEKLSKILKDKTSNEVEEILNKAQEVGISGVSENQFENMIQYLPVAATLFHGNITTENGKKIPMVMVTPDASSKNAVREMKDSLKEQRLNTITRLLTGKNNKISFSSRRGTKNADGTTNTDNINVVVVPRGFSKQTKLSSSKNNPALLDSEGKLMSREESDKSYESKVNDVLSTSYDKVVQELVQILNSVGYQVTEDGLTNDVVEGEFYSETALTHLLKGIAMFGDDILSTDTFVKDFLRKSAGKLVNKIGNNNLEKVSQKILDKMMDVSPDLFKSYKGYSKPEDTDSAIDIAISSLKKLPVKVTVDGNVLQFNDNNKQTVKDVVDLMESFIKDAVNREDLFDRLDSAGIKLSKEDSKRLGDYFIDRKFDRLQEQSSVFDFLSNSKETFEKRFNRISYRQETVEQSNIDEIKALGIIKDEATGLYYISRDKIQSLSKEMEGESNQSEDSEELSEAYTKEAEEAKDNALKIVKNSKLADAISSIKKAYSNEGVEPTDEQILKVYNDRTEENKRKISKSVLKEYIQQQYEDRLEELKEAAKEEESSEDYTPNSDEVINAAFLGKHTLPIVFGYGSSNGSIMAYNSKVGKVIPLSGSKGKAGSVYLILPYFLNPNNKEIPVKLNPGKIHKSVADALAEVFIGLANGKFSYDTMLSGNEISNVTIENPLTVRDFIDSLMFSGTEAIEHNPSIENMDRLVYVKDGKVMYGNTFDGAGFVANDQTDAPSLSQWIQDTKTYRIDRTLLQNPNQVVNGGFTIYDKTGKAVYEQRHGENYIGTLISNGAVKTSLSRSSNTVFSGGVDVYVQYGNSRGEKKVEEEADDAGNKNKNASTASKALNKATKKVEKESSETSVKDDIIDDIKNAAEEFFDDEKNEDEELYVTVDGKKSKIILYPNGSINSVKGIVFKNINVDKEQHKVILKHGKKVIFDSTYGTKKSSNKSEPVTGGNVAEIVEAAVTAALKAVGATSVKAQPEVKEENESTQKDVTLKLDDYDSTQQLKDKLTELGATEDQIKEALVAYNDDKETYTISKSKPTSSISSLNLDRLSNVPAGPKTAAAAVTSESITKESLKDNPVQTIFDKVIKEVKFDKGDDLMKKVNKVVNLYKQTVIGLPKEVMNPVEKAQLLGKEMEVKGKAIEYIKANTTLNDSITSFFRHFIRLENYDKALERVRKMLGDNFNFEIYTKLPFEYSHSKKAMVYVYGQCTSSALRIYRDARKNAVKRGTAYHEAFHKISMLLMSKQDRQAMYDSLIKYVPQLSKASEVVKQEFLAQMYAKFILKQISMENPLYKFFDKLARPVVKLLDSFRSEAKKNGLSNLNSLFEDMAKGKYAYLEASKENIEYFNDALTDAPAFDGYKLYGVEVANTSKQFKEIFRYLLSKLLANGVSLKDQENTFKKIKSELQEELKNAENILNSLDGTDLQVFQAAAGNYNILKSIVDNYSTWKKVLKDKIRTEFGIKQTSDPNSLSMEDAVEDQSGMEKTINNDESIVASYCRNQFTAMSDDIKILLYSIKETDEKGKQLLTDDGLPQFTNVFELWHTLCSNLSSVKDTDDMLNTISMLSDRQKINGESNTMAQLAVILQNVDSNILNRLFSTVVKYNNEFMRANYRVDDKTDENVFQYESSNNEQVGRRIQREWTDAIRNKIQYIQEIIQNVNTSTKDERDASRKSLQNAMPSQFTKSVDEAMKFFDFFGIEVDKSQVKQYLDKLSNTEKTSLNKSFTKIANVLKSQIIQSSSKNIVDIESITKVVNDIFNREEANPIVGLMEYLSIVSDGSAKTDSVTIAGGAKGYIISQFDHISRVFSRKIFDNNFMKALNNSPYAKTVKDAKNRTLYTFSKLLDFINKNGKNQLKLQTFAYTVVDNNNQQSRDFKGITTIEDVINKFCMSLTGNHLIPSLANKIKQYTYRSVPFEKQPLQKIGNNFSVNSSCIQTFKNYIAAELYTIREAYKTRDSFIKDLNKLTHSNFTVESFSKLGQEEQEKLMKQKGVGQLMERLKLKYHYKNKDARIIKNDDGTFTRRVFNIDLTSGNGYKSRHFKTIIGNLKINANTSDEEIAGIVNRDSTISGINEMMMWNIHQLLKFMQDNKVISGYNGLDSRSTNIELISLPKNVILDNKDINQSNSKNVTNDMIIKAVGYFLINNMSDNIEFEKVVSGDIAYLENITAVNKRYSAETSTVSIANSRGTIKNAFYNDDLYDSDKYVTVEVNTTIVDYIDKFKEGCKQFLGVDAFDETMNKVDSNPLNYKTLLDSDGNFKSEAKKGLMVKRYIEFRKQGRTYGIDKEGNPKTDEQLAKDIVNTTYNSLKAYRAIDPTDAQSWVSAKMYRQLLQREGEWSELKEAQYNLLENYDILDEIRRINKEEFDNMLKMLKVDETELMNNFKAYKEGKMSEEEYAGYIENKAPLIMGSLKYVGVGETENTNNEEFDQTYIKTSLSPVLKIFSKGHQFEELYNFMENNKVDMVKTESSTKKCNAPSFEMFDENGNIDNLALESSVKQTQYFNNLGKQLNTDPHEHNTATLLTQFMKIAMMNIVPENKYNINGTIMKGSDVLNTYRNVLDELTNRGYIKFCNKYGINPEDNSIDKEKFMESVKNMAQTQGVTLETLEALGVENGEFIINPSALPNINWIQSRLISDMDKTVIKTVTPGKPFFQTSSAGYDNYRGLKTVKDSKLKSYNSNNRMEVKIGISFFEDVIEKAGLKDSNFATQKKFLLDNQDKLLALAYRVPTQGQNSTLPIQIVDILEPQRGDIIMFPADITTLTGSDFDIDKMFTARHNFEVNDGEITPVKYDINNVEDNSDEGLQNLLLDMYNTILTNPDNRIATITPLDVTTDPLRDIKDQIEAIRKTSKDPREEQSGWFLNPLFQAEQRTKNSGSDNGIGPMALNNTFRAFIQASKLALKPNKYLDELGLSLMDNGKPRIYDRNGVDILDSTSALINAHVDAVKDNYIGRMNVNEYTFDVVSFLISCGMGNDTYWFLGQRSLIDLANNYIRLKNGQIGVDAEEASGNNFLKEIREDYISKIQQLLPEDEYFDFDSKATKSEMSTERLRSNISDKDSLKWYEQQLKYLNTFVYLKGLAEEYRQALRCAQIDTAKYGISANEMINFLQMHDDFISKFNTTFENPNALFDDTFLGWKLNKGIIGMFESFGNLLTDFSKGYKNMIDALSFRNGYSGGMGKMFTKRIGQRMKTSLMTNFFGSIIQNRYSTESPLREFLSGKDNVVSRYEKVKELASIYGTGTALFEVMKPANYQKRNAPAKFFIIDNSIKDDEDVKQNVAQAWNDLYNSKDKELSKYAEDLAMYMFFISGGTDSNASGTIKTTIFDLIPPRLLANIKDSNGVSYNEYTSALLQAMQNPTLKMDSIMDIAEQLNAQFSDEYAKTLYNKQYAVYELFNGQAITIKKGSNALINYSNGLFVPFVKRIDKVTGNFVVYKLGNLSIIKNSKTGKTYVNPIYFKINQIGNRSNTNKIFSVRADGFVDSEGKIKSLLNDNKNNVKSFKDLSEAYRKQFEKSGNVVLELDDDIMRNLAENTSDQTYKLMNLVDQADVIMYYADGNGDYYSTTKLLNYAKYRDNINSKPFTTIYSDSNISNMYKAGDSILIINTNSNDTTLLKTKVKNATVLTTDDTIQEGTYNRKDVAKDNKTLYIFTDNTDRTSGGNSIGKSWYSDKYGEDKGYGTDANPTTAVIRGLHNAAPISTMKWFYNIATSEHPKLKDATKARWTEKDVDEFTEVIDNEVEDIINMINSGKFNNIQFPNGGLTGNERSISNVNGIPSLKAKLEEAEAKIKVAAEEKFGKQKQEILGSEAYNKSKMQLELEELGKQRKKECK